MSHHDIWQAVDRLADLHDLSPSALAKKAGLDATTFNKSKRVMSDGKLRWPSTESIMRVLDATQTNWDEFVALMSDKSEVQVKNIANQHIPMLLLSQANMSQSFNAVGSPHGDNWDDIAFPNLQSGDIFALELDNNAHAPLYRENDKLVIDPHAELRKGDRVFVRTKNNIVHLQEIVRLTVKNIELKALNRGDVLNLNKDEIAVLGRIIWVSQ